MHSPRFSVPAVRRSPSETSRIYIRLRSPVKPFPCYGATKAQMYTTLFLVRNGDTDFSRDRRVAGRRDIGLSAVGRQQAADLAERLRSVELTEVLASPLPRAVETAELLAAPFN